MNPLNVKFSDWSTSIPSDASPDMSVIDAPLMAFARGPKTRWGGEFITDESDVRHGVPCNARAN